MLPLYRGVIRIDTFDLSEAANAIFEKAQAVLNRIKNHIGRMASNYGTEDEYLRAVIVYLNCIRATPAGLEEIYGENIELDMELIETLIQYIKKDVLSIPSEERSFAYRCEYNVEPLPDSAFSSSAEQKGEIPGLIKAFSGYFFPGERDKQLDRLTSILIDRYEQIDPVPDPFIAAAAILKIIVKMDNYLSDSLFDFISISDAVSTAFEKDIDEIDIFIRTLRNDVLTEKDLNNLEDMFPKITLPTKPGERIIEMDFVTGEEAEELERLIAEDHRNKAVPRKKKRNKPPENQLSLFD